MLRRTGPDTFVGTFADDSGTTTEVHSKSFATRRVPAVTWDVSMRRRWSGDAENLRALFAAVQAFDRAGEQGLLDEGPL